MSFQNQLEYITEQLDVCEIGKHHLSAFRGWFWNSIDELLRQNYEKWLLFIVERIEEKTGENMADFKIVLSDTETPVFRPDVVDGSYVTIDGVEIYID